MARPFRRGDGRWRLRIRDRRGRWINVDSSAQTRGEANRLNQELQIREDRYRLGVEVPPLENQDATLGAMIQWWIRDHLEGSPGYSRSIGTVRGHLLNSDLALLTPARVSSGRIEAFLNAKAKLVSPATVNHLRSYLSRVFGQAIRTERFFGVNPVTKVVKRKVTRRLPTPLSMDEARLVIAGVPDRWRDLFATALYTGLRKGELFALQKQDVDLSNRLLHVRRSHGRDTTKGGHEDFIPIHSELVPFLEAALTRSTSQLIFSRADGSRYPENTDLVSIIRTALRRAGKVIGYLHKCRRKGCGHCEESQDGTDRRCPKCNMKLWPTAQVRKVRFHDTRHTTASILILLGASPAAVQKILRHSDIRITMEIYAHLNPTYVREELEKLTLGATPSPRPVHFPDVTSVAPVTTGFAPPVLHVRSGDEIHPNHAAPNLNDIKRLNQSGWPDSNRRHPGPKPGALPAALHPEGRVVYTILSRTPVSDLGTGRPRRLLTTFPRPPPPAPTVGADRPFARPGRRPDNYRQMRLCPGPRGPIGKGRNRRPR